MTLIKEPPQARADARRLLREPDPAIIRLARALARQAAREDHARELAGRGGLDQNEGSHEPK